MILHRHDPVLDTGHFPVIDLLPPLAGKHSADRYSSETACKSSPFTMLFSERIQLYSAVLRRGFHLGNGSVIAVNDLGGHGILQLLFGWCAAGCGRHR